MAIRVLNCVIGIAAVALQKVYFIGKSIAMRWRIGEMDIDNFYEAVKAVVSVTENRAEDPVMAL